jgi:tocopherol O-methyltransferase
LASVLEPDTGDLTAVRDYYDQTWLDYRLFWLNRRNYAIHFGYWDAATRSHGHSLNRLNAVLAERIGIRAGQRVLDAGCGVGGSAVWLAQTYDVDVVGITPVCSQVQRAQQFASRRGVADRVRFLQEDYTRTTFVDASFDVVWAVESVCHAHDKPLFFRQARRVLRDGGRLGMVEYMRCRRPWADSDEALLQSWLSGWAIPDLATAAELRGWAEACGFHGVDLVDITANVRPSLRRLHRMAALAWPGAQLLQALRLRTAAQHGNLRGARDQYRALTRGLWLDAILTATA